MLTGLVTVDMVSRMIFIASAHPHAKGCHARNKDGILCEPTSVHARSFSMEGALRRAARMMGQSDGSRTARNIELCQALQDILAAMEAVSWEKHAAKLNDFNDRPETTRADVLTLLYAIPVELPAEPYPVKEGVA